MENFINNIIDNKTREKLLKIILPIFIVLTVILLILLLIKSLPDKELISTKTYEIYELYPGDVYIYYTFIDENSKINKDSETNKSILRKIYLGDKNQITVENLGYNGKISKVKLIKFYVTDETYKELSEKFEWEDDYNM